MNNVLDQNYLKNKTFVKFLIIEKKKIDFSMLESMLYGFLDNLMIISKANYYLVIYTNKEYVEFRNYYDSMSFDIGFSFKIFEGFKVQVKDIDYIKYVEEMYVKYFQSLKEGYYSIRDLILISDNEELLKIKHMLLDKYDLTEFEQFINVLFEYDLNVSKASKYLYMHRNTVNNKIDSFKNDTGIRLSKFKDAISIYRLCNLHID